MEKVIVSVGMGPGQLEFIRQLKADGYKVAAFGKGKNSEEAVLLSDYHAEIDTRDAEGAIIWLEQLGVEVLAVGSFAGGAAVPTVQKISNHFHVATEIPDEFIVGSDKSKQQKLYEKYELSSICTWKAGELTDKVLLSDENELYIIKPAVGRGSEGIEILNKAELMKRLHDVSVVPDDDIVQVVRQGNEYRCVVIIQNKKLKLFAPVLRKSYKDTVFLGVLRYSDKDIERMEHFITDFIEKSDIKNAILKADIIVSEKKIDVIEMDIGVGGGSYYKKYISRLYERNIMDEYIRLITNQPVEEFAIARPNLRMDYVFNHSEKPVLYDLEECNVMLEEKFGRCEIQINQLHPESKGGYHSNADFIFTVMYEMEQKEDSEMFALDEFVNMHLLKEID